LELGIYLGFGNCDLEFEKVEISKTILIQFLIG
jgi:hypothetical protein